MLLGLLLKQAIRRLLPLPAAITKWPMPLADEDDIPSTVRIDAHTSYIPDTTPLDGWYELAERQAYRAAWTRRKALRFGATTRTEAQRVAMLDLLQRQRHRHDE
jgi:hypothetical protein